MTFGKGHLKHQRGVTKVLLIGTIFLTTHEIVHFLQPSPYVISSGIEFSFLQMGLPYRHFIPFQVFVHYKDAMEESGSETLLVSKNFSALL